MKNCHPRESVASVLEIIDAFRKGERDEIDFWLELHGKFIYITTPPCVMKTAYLRACSR